VVAITGSYGKTSTKHHLAELWRTSRGRSVALEFQQPSRTVEGHQRELDRRHPGLHRRDGHLRPR
jgi:hypothetical protein